MENTTVTEQPKKRGRPKGSKALKSSGKFTAKKKRLFLNYLKKSGNKAGAAAKIGVGRSLISYHEKQDPHFAEEVQKALAFAEQEIDEEVYRRGIEGVKEDVWYQGDIVGEKTTYSDRMLEFRAKTLNPERYGDKSKVDLNAHVELDDSSSAKAALAAMLGIMQNSAEDGEYIEVDD